MAATVIRSDASPQSEPGLRSRVGSQLLGGSATIHEGVLAPKELVPPHTHAHEDQCVYVVWGTVNLEVGDESVEASAGTYVVKPRGVPHALWNPGTEPALVLEISSPGGFGSFCEEIANASTDAERESVKNRYGMTFHNDQIADLVQRHGLG